MRFLSLAKLHSRIEQQDPFPLLPSVSLLHSVLRARARSLLTLALDVDGLASSSHMCTSQEEGEEMEKKWRRKKNTKTNKVEMNFKRDWMPLIETAERKRAGWSWMAESRWVIMALVERFVLLSPSLAAEKPCGEICPSSLTDWLVGEEGEGGGGKREGESPIFRLADECVFFLLLVWVY